ncbi:MAG: PAS domain S-box protein, partial [Deltaproteobacteria bacterium]|nr:PAS domain S-box protein [Deltaproteobacteria bacterium]
MVNDRERDDLLRELKQTRQRAAELERRLGGAGVVSPDFGTPGLDFRVLAEKLGVGIFLIQDGILKYVNPKFARIFGYEHEEAVKGLEARSVVVPEDWPEAEGNIRKRMGGEVDAIQFQFSGVKSNGEKIHVEAFGSRTDYEGRPAVIGTLVDISERIQDRDHLTYQLKIFRALHDLVLAMVGETTLDENLSRIVDRSRELLGTDTAWIAFHDHETKELYWYISSGLTSEAFRKLRVPVGKGLAGKVAESGHWLIVEDYYREIGPEFHAVTRSEGLMSGIAVPVQIGEVNYGILFAFNRTKTRFSGADLDTLSLFGNLAAVEITRK